MAFLLSNITLFDLNKAKTLSLMVFIISLSNNKCEMQLKVFGKVTKCTLFCQTTLQVQECAFECFYSVTVEGACDYNSNCSLTLLLLLWFLP